MDHQIIQSDTGGDTAVRLIQQLKIRIGEAKNLQPKNGANSLKDCFCVIKLDQEEIIRTHCATEKTLHPFFGEEFYFDIPRVFRYLSFYLYERERTVNTIRNRPLGKVTICRNYLCKYSSEEAWFPLVPTHYESETKGKINLTIEPRYIFGSNTLRIIVVIINCVDLSDDCCDSYAVVDLKYLNDIQSRKSKVQRKTANPHYNESFVFEIHLDECSNDLDRFSNDDNRLILDKLLNNSELSRSKTLGELAILMNRFEINRSHSAWYYLKPKNSYQKSNFNLGSLRLRINYISDYVFSSQSYDHLRSLLLSSAEIKPITSSIVYLLGEFVLNKADAAQPIVKIFLHYRKFVPLIRYLAEDEISKVTDPNTIFRGNSLLSKCIDELMKLVGLRYLHDTLKQCVEAVIVENLSCEVDPSKIKIESFETNINNLKQYTSLFFNAITSSMSRCPQVMCEIFSVLKELAIKFFPDNKEVCYFVISGFVFLRFFAPSILNPRLFELTDRNISPQVNRTFTLISKTIQSIGNLVFSKKNSQIIKENYMMSFYKDFITDFHIYKTKEFLESISSSCRLSTKDAQEPLILKESIMFKKSKYKRIGFGTTYKKRYFCITTQHFFYAKTKNKSPLFKLPISEISVKKISTDGFKNMFQVIHNKCTLSIQASNCVQEREWIDTLNRLIQLNQNTNTANKLLSFDSTKHSITPDLSIKLDPEREFERIYSLFASNQNNIQLIIDSCENDEVVKIWKGNSRTHPSQFVIEDYFTLMQTLVALKDCVGQLEQKHRQYLLTITGSEIAPIELD